MRIPATQDIMATRYDLADLRSYLNILSAEQIVQILIRELTGRSPAGYHEYALLKLAFGSTYQIPEPPSAPGAVNTVQAGFTSGQSAAVPDAAPAAAPVPAAPVPVTPSAAPQSVPVAAPAAVPVTPSGNEADAAFAAAVKAGVATPPQAAPAAQVVGDPVPAFNKEAFLARLAQGGNQ